MHAAIFGPVVGLTDAQLQATVNGGADDPAWSEAQGLLIEFADELHRHRDRARRAVERAVAALLPEQLVELVALAGQYHAVAFFANALGVAPRMPPGGSPPAPTGSRRR